ncbi:hypothetical protein JOC78_001021 [Bacillus ectoiniformans]|uniref:DUF4262 domain-containing protein n=1 Tax=Bacillus ectoiniformans TaxID=1494429 RepID=UPI00195CE10B|nr:DUF4262 domain-containing protein [Bacillus ectoiniformans]MBM7648081.1 hypothetical protein [Bacillus ectoiniformans]
MNEQWENQMLEEYGWYMDAIYAEEYDGVHANYHTHGVQENFNHVDFQIVLDMNPKVVNDIFYTLIDFIKSGRKFEESKEYTDIIEGFKVGVKQYKEMGRDVLRVLLPDENGTLPTENDCNEYYKSQLDDYNFDSNN